ncbi:flap endonuclease 1-like [Varroa jacobsoni]|uniref:Flap endonuclease 1 n=1 Tax=Varroa destructor TaxID=109461 RepID=A0A7M7J869_VARDE|nr:flap endonuclease 1-like [Varroa destructor]XP_022708792.1 flap endonuclease 1-like [Varroa jacobsoni]
MGILGLSKLIADVAPGAIKEGEIKNFFGRKIALDASMCLYQFLIAVRQENNMLTNADGETTSHLVGFFYRTIRMIENGIKPLYVFDGKPPDLKIGELEKRAERREEAQKELEKATEFGNQEDINKYQRRLVKVTKQHNEDAKRLLDLMGVPFLEAPCEAEAQCAELVKSGKVFAAATEDMDCLTFGAPIVLRHMTFSEARKMPIKEFTLSKILSELEFTQREFIDLCILLGCDYCESIKGIGPKRAIDLMRQHRSIENILQNLDTKKYTVPENWQFERARELFEKPEVTPGQELEFRWMEPNEDGLVKFLCEENGFNEERIRNGAKKLHKGKNSSQQGRLDSFFKVLPSTPAPKRKFDIKKEAVSSSKRKKTGNAPYKKAK